MIIRVGGGRVGCFYLLLRCKTLESVSRIGAYSFYAPLSLVEEEEERLKDAGGRGKEEDGDLIASPLLGATVQQLFFAPFFFPMSPSVGWS